MSGGVVDGSPINASNTNAAFIDANGDDFTIGILGLQNTNPVSGSFITNVQRGLNNLFAFVGMADETVTSHDNSSGPLTYLALDNLDTRVRKLDAALSNTTSGHNHNGVNSKQITFLDILNVQLIGYAINGTNITGVTGSSKDVSSILTGEFPSNSQTVKGIVVNAPYNYCPLFDSNDDSFLDGTGNKVYGRLTESSGVWTLSFFSDISGTETSYSFASSTLVKWFYQKLFDETDRPVYSDVLVRTSDQVAGIVPDASQTVSGKVNISSQSFGGLKTFKDGARLENELSITRVDTASAASITALTYKPFQKITGSTETYLRGVGSGADGRTIIIHNGTTQTLHIQHEDGAASASDRIKLPLSTNINLKPDQSIELIYDSNQSRWVQKSGSGTGNGSGSGFRNFITNTDAENDVLGWFTFQDAAASTPVDGVGGSPSVTLTRSVSSPLRGLASFLLTKGAFNAQGQGASFGDVIATSDFVIDNADKNKPFQVSFDFEASSGYLANDVGVWIYDTTNNQLLPLSQNLIPYKSGSMTATFNTTNSNTYRLIIFIASTNATAWTFKFDNVFFGAQQNIVLGPVDSDWELDNSINPDPIAFGTVTNLKVFSKRIGDSKIYRGYFTAGSANVAQPYLLFTGINLDADKLNSDNYKDLLGTAYGVYNATVSLGAANVLLAVTWNGVDTDRVQFVWREVGASSNGYVLGADTAASLITAGTAITFEFIVPIKGWSSDVITANSRVFKICDYLSVGTNVTSTPSALGEYRTYKQVASSGTGVDDTTSQTSLSIRNDGFKIFGVGYSNAGNTGEPNRVEIFVGKNKNVKLITYSNTGRTGWLQSDHLQLTSTVEEGIVFTYDPTTGVAVCDIIPTNSSTTTRYVGNALPVNGGSYSAQAFGYFDIIVSDNPLSVQFGDDCVYIKDVKSSGTDGGTFTSGSWQTRDLNTLENKKPWVSLSSNQFTLDPGKYSIEASAPAFGVDGHKIKLFNITDSLDSIMGSAEYSNATNTSQTRSFLLGEIVLTGSKLFEIRHFCTTTKSTNGFGNSIASSGTTEIFTNIKIKKIN